DLNDDDSETFIHNLIKLRDKGYDITLIDHHQFAESYDKKLKMEGIQVIRDTKVSCSELVFQYFIKKIEEKRKAEFLLCIGAIGDRIITPYVQNVINSFRREEIFDVYACLLAGITNGKDFLYSVFEEKDKDRIGFAKKLYYRATKKRFWIEKLKARINNLQESIGTISIVHIFQKHIGFAASYLIDQDNTDFAIAIGDGPPDFRNRFYIYLENFLNFILRRKKKQKNDTIRLSFRSKIPINELISSISKKYHGFGGGHKFACGASIPQEELVSFLREIIREFKKL
ncbi:MAG: DHHA1 domain-containing protein, partial [Promethearchaeota archaeon]